MTTFLELGLKEEICNALSDLGYKQPTVIQEKAIPQVLASTKNIKAFAQTGTGKTAAFSLPILEKIEPQKQIQAVILSPTRELAVQIGKNIQDFSKYVSGVKVTTVYGGANIEEQIRSLKKGTQIVVGTPGRTVDLIKRNVLKLENIRWLVLDEADEMLNMGFKEELDQILEVIPENKQTLLFSATFPKEVEEIAKNYMTDPLEITSGQKNEGSNDVSHKYYLVSERTRYPALKRIVDKHTDIYAIVFCRTRRETQEVANHLIKDGYNADALHGDLSQAQRDHVMKKFRMRSIQILVATDVAAKGLDVNNLSHVINHKFPDQIEAYTHRSGRTGRAGNKGVSIVLATKKDKAKLKPIERILKKKFVEEKIPSGKEICQNQLLHLVEKVRDVEVNKSQIEAFLPAIYENLEGFDREELIQKFISLQFHSFFSYYEGAPDLNDLSSSKGNMSRFFVNIGKKDHLTPARLIGLINDQKIADTLAIGAIDILDTFSFFEIDQAYELKVLEAFEKNAPQFEGRGVKVEITKKERSGKGAYRKSGRKPFRNKKEGFGRKRPLDRGREDKKTGGFGRRRRHR